MCTCNANTDSRPVRDAGMLCHLLSCCRCMCKLLVTLLVHCVLVVAVKHMEVRCVGELLFRRQRLYFLQGP